MFRFVSFLLVVRFGFFRGGASRPTQCHFGSRKCLPALPGSPWDRPPCKHSRSTRVCVSPVFWAEPHTSPLGNRSGSRQLSASIAVRAASPQEVSGRLHTGRCTVTVPLREAACTHAPADGTGPNLPGGVLFRPAVPASNRWGPFPRPRSLLQTACGNCSDGPCFKPSRGYIRAPWVQAPTTRGGWGLPRSDPQASTAMWSRHDQLVRPPAARLLTDAAAGIVNALAKKDHP